MDRFMDKILIGFVFTLTFLILIIVGIFSVAYRVNDIYSIIVRMEGESNQNKAIRHQ